MSQIRLYTRASEKQCEDILERLSAHFFDDEYAMATQEIDEDKDIWETSVYTTKEDEASVRSALKAILHADFPACEIETEILPDIDWVAKSLEGLQPVRAGRFLVHGSHDRDKIKPGDLAIEIDAGQAFGTGHHGTTAGCLETIERVMAARDVKNVLDLGTGSGVLAIAAYMIRPIPVLATDIDPVAVDVAAENVKNNGIQSGITLHTAPGFDDPIFAEHGPFDLVIANILARPLMDLAPDLTKNVAANGSIILSGILEEQHDKVLEAYKAQELTHVETIHLNGWVTIELSKGE